MANTRSRRSPQWRTLYDAAFLESERDKLLQRITDALRAIMDRMEDLNWSEDGPEREAALDALSALHGLRMMADSDRQSQK